MGSYCDYKIGKWEIETSKSYIIPELTIAFQEADKKTGFTENEDGKYRYIKYECTAEIARMRLDALGYTIKNAENILLNTREKWIKDYGYSLPTTPKGIKKCFLKSNINDWIEAYRLIRENNYKYGYLYKNEWDLDTTPDLVRIALETDETYYGFPANAPYIF